MTTSKIQMDQIRSTSATDTGENIRAGSQKKSSLSPAEGLQGASPDATCTCPSGDGSLRHPCPVHPAVEQAGGDEREAFEKIHTVPRGIMWNEEKSQYVRVHEKHCSLRTWNSFVALWAGWMARAALAQPSPKSGYYSDQEWINAGCPPEQPSPVQAEQAEVERPEVVARVVHSTPVVLDQCGPLNANDEMMTVAQHAASVARWAEMFNRVEQERDAAMAKCAELKAELAMANDAAAKGDAARHQCAGMEMEIKELRGAADHWEAESRALQKQRDVALARVAELGANLGAALGLLRESRGFVDCDNPLNESGQIKLLEEIDAFLNSPVAQAQHSVPEEFIGRLSEFLAQRGATGKALLRELRTMLATVGDK